MTDYEVVETIYGKSSKFEVVRKGKAFGGYDFYVLKDGKLYKGSYSSLNAAVDAARAAG